MSTFHRFRAIAALVGPLLLAGCASWQPVDWRLQLRTVDDWPDLQQLADRVAAVAGVPVAPDVAGIAPRWYALTLQCPNRSACKHATMKLAAQPALLVELHRDESRRVPTPPNQEAAR